ncbi:MAG: dihydroxyacetone kinase subunit DhaK [Deltaproteobacteria bacterium]|nr:dihydroxyacetone kinase subunit DhaK [Deltaproteobacteria bacterium]MBW2122005.1 dihydroxyacetone kinase subunit DhaK [Deltaproteobacteria bacterium]
MKKFINDPFHVVDEMLEGFLAVHGRYLRRLESARTVVRADAPVQGKVGVVTGGGSGHKPAFIGFVGKGMLDAVAVGEIFTSPPPNAVFEAARAVNGGRGVLFLLGNYAGDVMNFQLAADMARAEGIAVEQVIATDDVGSGPKEKASNRRGVVGEFLAWKIAGAKAEAGGSLEECRQVAEKVNSYTRTLGVALSPCTVPAKGTPTFTLAEDEMEYGVGHHGEPGTAKIKLMTADEVTEKMTGEILEDLPFGSGDEVAVLINGLGATPLIELYVCFRKVKQILDGKGIKIERSYVGEYFTALEMAGFSITLMKLDPELKSLLEAPADTPYYRL